MVVGDAYKRAISISPRERDILRCLSKGFANKKMAAALGVTTHTIKNQMTFLLAKFNVDDRLQLLVKVLQLNVLKLNPHTHMFICMDCGVSL